MNEEIIKVDDSLCADLFFKGQIISIKSKNEFLSGFYCTSVVETGQTCIKCFISKSSLIFDEMILQKSIEIIISTFNPEIVVNAEAFIGSDFDFDRLNEGSKNKFCKKSICCLILELKNLVSGDFFGVEEITLIT